MGVVGSPRDPPPPCLLLFPFSIARLATTVEDSSAVNACSIASGSPAHIQADDHELAVVVEGPAAGGGRISANEDVDPGQVGARALDRAIICPGACCRC
eukprot:2107693-Pyramimonas_sp.AAC.1